MNVIAEAAVPDDAHDPLRSRTAPPGLPVEQTARPGEERYEDWTVGFNTTIRHRPDLAFAARSGADVRAAVRHAAETGTGVTLQCTGHGFQDPVAGGLLVDVSGLDTVSFDAAARTVTVGGGVRWRDLIDDAVVHGLAAPCGSTSDVGVVGYLLGGGLPVLGRAFGYAADRVRSFEAVTADGEERTVSPETDPELFWALRGGGRGLCAVTAVTLEMLELTEIAGGGLFFPGEHAASVLAAFADWATGIPDELCASLAFLRLPPLPEVPEPLRGRLAMHLRVTHPDPGADMDALLAPMRACAPVVLDTVGVLPCSLLDRIHNDPDHPAPAADRGMLLDGLDDAIQAALLAVAGPDSGCPLLVVELRVLGGALRTPPQGGDAIGGRDAAYSLYGVGLAAGPDAEAVSTALDALGAALAPHASARSLLNLQGSATRPAERRTAWNPEQFARLCRVKERVDPTDLFRHGHVLSPA